MATKKPVTDEDAEALVALIKDGILAWSDRADRHLQLYPHAIRASLRMDP